SPPRGATETAPAAAQTVAAASATAAEESARRGRVTREAFAWSEIEEALVPVPADRMSLHSLLNPLEGELFTSREPGDPDSLHEWKLDFLRTDLRNSLAGPTGSPEKALFPVLWQSRLLLKELIVAGHIDRVSVDMEICGWFEGFVSGICDGPPPQRIAELLALAEAGVVSFIGPDMRIEENTAALDTAASDGAEKPRPHAQETHPEIFTVTSAQVVGEITGGVVIDAASPTNSVARAAAVLLHGMLERGQPHRCRPDLGAGAEDAPQLPRPHTPPLPDDRCRGHGPSARIRPVDPTVRDAVGIGDRGEPGRRRRHAQRLARRRRGDPRPPLSRGFAESPIYDRELGVQPKLSVVDRALGQRRRLPPLVRPWRGRLRASWFGRGRSPAATSRCRSPPRPAVPRRPRPARSCRPRSPRTRSSPESAAGSGRRSRRSPEPRRSSDPPRPAPRRSPTGTGPHRRTTPRARS